VEQAFKACGKIERDNGFSRLGTLRHPLPAATELPQRLKPMLEVLAAGLKACSTLNMDGVIAD